jgi:hypothetical protein
MDLPLRVSELAQLSTYLRQEIDPMATTQTVQESRDAREAPPIV